MNETARMVKKEPNYTFPYWVARRMGLDHKKISAVYCPRCAGRNNGRGHMLGYLIDKVLAHPISKGKERTRWDIIREGCICCDEGHLTCLEDGVISTVDSEGE